MLYWNKKINGNVHENKKITEAKLVHIGFVFSTNLEGAQRNIDDNVSKIQL